jgi:type IV pilus assembly protein PilN
MRVTLNLATRPFADLGPAIKRLRIGMAVLAVVAIGLGVGLHAIHQKAEAARARDHSLDGQIAHLDQEREGYQAMMHKPDNAAVLDQAEFLNKLFDEKAFSWTLAMEDLETVLPGGVQVTTLEPARAKDGHITLHLRVVGPRDRSVELVRNLEHSRRFLLPRIVGENASETTAGPNQRLAPVSASDRFDFDLQAEYNPSKPEERKATRKLKPSGEISEERPGAAGRAVHPLPLPTPGQGRQPYTGQAQPVQVQPVRPMQSPQQLNRAPMGRGPGAPPLPVPVDRPNGGPQ